MSTPDYPHIREAAPRILTETEYAQWRAEDGVRVSLAHGRYWREGPRGFYQCVHWLGRLSAEEAQKPSPLCWAFHTSLRDEDSMTANVTWPLCMLRDLDGYDEDSLSHSTRRDVLKGRRNATYVRLTDSVLLREQGYEVYASAIKRIGMMELTPRDRYLDRLDRYAGDDRRMVVAAIVGNRLAGYCDSFAVDGYAYGWNLYVASDFLTKGITLGMLFETWQAFRRSGEVLAIVNGMHTPENPGLMAFKERLGFRVVHVPSRLWMLRPAQRAIRRVRPWGYYRLTGHGLETFSPA
jgi:hypothetical protein